MWTEKCYQKFIKNIQNLNFSMVSFQFCNSLKIRSKAFISGYLGSEALLLRRRTPSWYLISGLLTWPLKGIKKRISLMGI
jgi:hypothetical protein